jgi:hypothetical protein
MLPLSPGLLSILALVTATAAPFDPYPVLWNSNSIDAAALKSVGLRPNTHRASGPNPVVDWSCHDAPASWCTAPFKGYCVRGLWPLITTTGGTVNGGVPQAANLSAHLVEIRRTLPLGVAANYTGIVAIDFEDWSPIWSEDTVKDSWHSVTYQNHSISLVLSAQPKLSLAQATIIAKKGFEKAALEFFVETIMLCRRLRPNAKWGYCKRILLRRAILALQC